MRAELMEKVANVIARNQGIDKEAVSPDVKKKSQKLPEAPVQASPQGKAGAAEGQEVGPGPGYSQADTLANREAEREEALQRLGGTLGGGAIGGAAGYGVASAFDLDKTISTLAGMFGGGAIGYAMAQYLVRAMGKERTAHAQPASKSDISEAAKGGKEPSSQVTYPGRISKPAEKIKAPPNTDITPAFR